jgi:putative FmdB family regulatory protein
MPLYEFDCQACQEHSELLVRSTSEKPCCPKCGSQKMQKLLSIISAPVIQGGKGTHSTHELPSTGGCGKPQCGTGGCMFGN